MGVRWTKRPQNFCGACGYSWYPKGKNRAAQCPRCGSPQVELAFEGCLRALFYLVASPLILVIIVFQLLVRFLAGAAKILARAVPVVGRWTGRRATTIAEWSAPLRGAVFARAARLAKSLHSHILFIIRWVVSVKEDLFGTAEREINPLSLVSKLLVIVALSTTSLIILISIIISL
jgi:hypothetical protein